MGECGARLIQIHDERKDQMITDFAKNILKRETHIAINNVKKRLMMDRLPTLCTDFHFKLTDRQFIMYEDDIIWEDGWKTRGMLNIDIEGFSYRFSKIDEFRSTWEVTAIYHRENEKR